MRLWTRNRTAFLGGTKIIHHDSRGDVTTVTVKIHFPHQESNLQRSPVKLEGISILRSSNYPAFKDFEGGCIQLWATSGAVTTNLQDLWNHVQVRKARGRDGKPGS
jgi:hypothetical protein